MVGIPRTLLIALVGLLLFPGTVSADETEYTYIITTPNGTPGPHGCGAMGLTSHDVCWGDIVLAAGVDSYRLLVSDAAWGDRVAYEVCWIQSGDLPSCAHFGHSLLPLRCRGAAEVSVPEQAGYLLVHFEASFFDLDGPCGATAGVLVATS